MGTNEKRLVNEIVGSTALQLALSLTGLPFVPQIILGSTPAVIRYVSECTRQVYDDVLSRQLSAKQRQRLYSFSENAYIQFIKRIKNDGWTGVEHPEAGPYLNNLFESQEFAIIKALQESQTKKDIFYGVYWGNVIYEHDEHWEDQHFIISLLSKLSFRQLILVKLIVEGFAERNKDMFITRPEISIELSELQSLGLWGTYGIEITQSLDNSRSLQHIRVTDFGKSFYNKLDLASIISQEDENSVIKDMALRSDLEATSTLYWNKEGSYAEEPPEK